VTVGIAILRRRLYEIDIIINRTLVYGLLTAILAGLFAGTVSLSQKLFVALTGQTSDLATVLATLCIVAAFTPVKNRLQGMVDRRFKDASDAIPHLKAFGEQVRLRLSPVDARQVTSRLLDETVAAFDAQGGAAYLEQEDQLRLIHTTGEWSGVTVLDVPLEAGDRRLGVLSLGERRNRRSYRPKEREALERVAQAVAAAIVQDSQ
jgi:GAF domain